MVYDTDHLDHLVKVASARFSHWKVTIFLLVTSRYLRGRYLETIQIYFFLRLALTDFGMNPWPLPATMKTGVF